MEEARETANREGGEGAAAVVRALDFPVVLLGPTGVIVEVNSAAGRLVQTPPTQLRGCSGAEWEEALNSATEPVPGAGGLLQTRARPARIYDRHTTRLELAGGLTLICLQDRTDAHQLRREHDAHQRDLLHLQSRSDLAERFQSELAQNVTHDLRTPLASIKAAASGLLAEDVPYDPALHREALTLIEEEADRLQRRVTNILSLARMEAGREPIQADWVDAADVVASALDSMRPLWQGRPVLTTLAEDLPLIRADYDQLGTAVRNLIENALLYSPPGSPLEISAETGLDQLLIRVRDRGPGIMPDEAEKVFEKFYRGRYARRIPGTGLGLPICRRIAEAHHGSLWVEHVPGGGACFVLALPIPESAPSAREAADRSSPDGPDARLPEHGSG